MNWRAYVPMIGAALALLTIVIVTIALAEDGMFVTVPGIMLLVAPLYFGLLWLIFERQTSRDDAEEATRVSRAAYRTAHAIEDYLQGNQTPPTGRHHR